MNVSLHMQFIDGGGLVFPLDHKVLTLLDVETGWPGLAGIIALQ